MFCISQFENERGVNMEKLIGCDSLNEIYAEYTTIHNPSGV